MTRPARRLWPVLVSAVLLAGVAGCSATSSGQPGPTTGSTSPAPPTAVSGAPQITEPTDTIGESPASGTESSAPAGPAPATLSAPPTIATSPATVPPTVATPTVVTPTPATRADPPSPTGTADSPAPTRSSSPATPLPAVGLVGVNVPGCRSASPPVVLLHGTFSTAAGNFAALAPALVAAGHCVYAVNYGDRGVAAVTDSARDVAAFVELVRADTGAAQVDVVGYSQGGLVLRTALRQDGLADRVRVAVLLAPTFHGTTAPGLASLGAVCPACADQAAGSTLLRTLDAGGDLDGSVRYAVLSSRDDTVVTPISAQVPQGPGNRVRSLIVQDQCPHLLVQHVGFPAVTGVVHWVIAALADDGRPAASALSCTA